MGLPLFLVCPAELANPACCKKQASPRTGGRQSDSQGRCWQRQGLKEAIGSKLHTAEANLIRRCGWVSVQDSAKPDT